MKFSFNLFQSKTFVSIASVLGCFLVFGLLYLFFSKEESSNKEIVQQDAADENPLFKKNSSETLATSSNKVCSKNVQWNLQVDQKKYYQVRYDAKNQTNQTIQLKGRLNVRYALVDQEVGYIGFQLNPIEVFVEGIRDAEKENLLANTVFSSSHIHSTGAKFFYLFPEHLENQEKQWLENMLHLIQVKLYVGDQWKAQEEDGLGRYVAEYQKTSDCNIQKSKQNYMLLSHKAYTDVQKIQVSNASLEFSMGQHWFDTLEGKEKILYQENQDQLVVLEHSIEMKDIGVQNDLDLLLWSLGAKSKEQWVNAVLSSSHQLPKELLADVLQKKEQKEFQGLSVQEAFMNLEYVVAKMQKHSDTIQSLYDFSRYLKAYPQKAYEVLPLLEDASDPMSARVIHALEVAGTKEAQDVLVQIAETSEVGNQKIQAIVSMGALENPNEDTLAKLWDFTEGNLPDLRGDITNDDTALLALGSIASTLQKEGNDKKKATLIVDRLLKKLSYYGIETKKNPVKLIVTLDSLYNAYSKNTPPEKVRKAVMQYLSYPNPEVQAKSIQFLASFADSESFNYLENGLQSNVYKVRKASLNALGRQALLHKNKKSIDMLSKQLEKETSDILKTEIVQHLVDVQQQFPDVKKNLQQHLIQEESEVVRDYIQEVLN